MMNGTHAISLSNKIRHSQDKTIPDHGLKISF